MIYELLADVKGAMEGLLEPVLEETVIGHVEVRQLFKTPGGIVAGSYVTDGKAQRGARARVVRDDEVIHTGSISSLRHVKEDVREMGKGFECGVMIEGFNTFEVGDVIEVFVVEEIARKL